MNPRKRAIKELEQNGYVLKRSGGNHDIYFHPIQKTIIPLKRHNFDEDTFRYILKEIRRQGKETV